MTDWWKRYLQFNVTAKLTMIASVAMSWRCAEWFMDLEAPNFEQSGLISVVVGAGAAWFGLYVNGKSSKISSSKEPKR